ncbi:hypothetical protein KI387_010379, partial [Taxus chinensis]
MELKAAIVANESQKGFRSLLCSQDRDFLLTNNGNKVKVDELEGKNVGLYFSAHWCAPCRVFTPLLSDIYTKILDKERDFEIIFISADVDEQSFEKYHHLMPWLALPFSDVPVSTLVGKTVGLYFSAHWSAPCLNFTPQLVDIYNDLKSRGEDFEIVFLSANSEENAFQEYYGSMPWLALPFGDKTGKKLSQYFQVQGIPALIVIGPNGKTVQTKTVSLVQRYGIRAYPFTTERLKEIEGRKQGQTLESLLVSDTRDFVIKHGGEKVPVSDLVGKTVALYFSAHWCPPCQAFTPKLIQVYNELKESGEAFDIVFISNDEDQGAFEDYFSTMPWLALPFGDKTEKDLSHHFLKEGIPTLIVIGPDGKTVTDDAISAVSIFGAEAYPFTALQIGKLQKKIEDLAEKSPKEINCSQHEHPLVLTRKNEFNCDGCDEEGGQWSYYCEKCDFDIHLICALKDQQWLGSNDNQQNEDGAANDICNPAGVICDGDVCYR